MSDRKPELFKRRRPAHFPPVDRFNESTILFLTVCVQARRPLLANLAAHESLRSAWTQGTAWIVGRYIIMPDHVHLFCSPGRNPSTKLKNWVSFWRNHVTRAWPNAEEKPIWQKDYWDTQLRKGDSYSAKWQYVFQNPVRAGLVKDASEWPYQGEISQLVWFGK